MNFQPTERFTSRVENYVRYRPGYPKAIIPLLQRETGLEPWWVIADIGSGPGNFTTQLLEFGATVYGVEPNQAMRDAGEVLMADQPRYFSVDGTAEATSLADNSVELVTAAQAFHWFDPASARTEFQRILKTPGWVALIWNRRPAGHSEMLDEYHAMLRRWSEDFDRVSVRDDRAKAGMDTLFGVGGYKTFTLPNDQLLDAEGFWGRLLSSSYVPLEGQPGHDEIRQQSRQIFDTFSVDGWLRFPYETQVFIGNIT